jgi:hypothetical protein
MAVDRKQMKGYIAEIMEGVDLEELSAKKVREQLEQKMGLEQDALKSERATISAVIEVLEDGGLLTLHAALKAKKPDGEVLADVARAPAHAIGR